MFHLPFRHIILWFLVLCIAVPFGAVPARAHGVAANGGALPGVEKPEPGWFARWLKSFEAEAAARVRVDEAGGFRYIQSDGLPDHATGTFPNARNPNAIREQSYNFRVALHPEKTGTVRPLGRHPFGVALNGVTFEPLTAEFWNRDPSSGWNIEALSGKVNLGLDASNAHVQPNGGYHYHGIPTALFERLAQNGAPVLLGYAADGFPVYGPYNGATSSHRIKQGARPGGPGGAYDGTYVEDYEYVAGLGTLDQCNGRTGVTPDYPDGTYHYVLTDRYPFIPRCYMGTFDDSFLRRGPGGGENIAPGAGGRRGDDGGLGPGMRSQTGAGAPQGRPPSGAPNLDAAARELGVDLETLRRALGAPPPDFARAARRLGVDEGKLRRALGH